MSDGKELVLQTSVQLGTIELATPRDVVITATAVAKELAKIIEDKKLYVAMKNGKYVKVEGWATLGSMLGITPKEKFVNHTYEGEGIDRVHQFEAYMELVRNSDGQVIGGASAICRTDEELKRREGSAYKRWGGMDLNAPRSMAITRATSKALRIALAWIMVLGGYKPTPAEEMETVDIEFTEVKETAKTEASAPQAKSAADPNAPKSPQDWTTYYKFADTLMDHESAVKMAEARDAVKAYEYVKAKYG